MTASATKPTTSAASALSVRERIEAWCLENGYRLGHHGSCGHDCGLPRRECAWVEPDWSPVDGDHVLLVAADAVIQAVCPYPWGDNDWQIRATHSYATADELKRILDRLVRQQRGCWG